MELFSSDLEASFNNLFKFHQIDVDIKKTDIYLKLKRLEHKGIQEMKKEKNKPN